MKRMVQGLAGLVTGMFLLVGGGELATAASAPTGGVVTAASAGGVGSANIIW